MRASVAVSAAPAFAACDEGAPQDASTAMTRTDWLLAGAFTLASFVVCVLWVQFPAQRYFDEIYYARAGEEYLKHLDVSGWGPFEFTHPPLTKLVIALSMLAFGGLHGLGNTGLGWRFGNVVAGALMVGVIYLFAKRLSSSTLVAGLAATMLLCDGFHFVQSRIATPEITVAFLSLATLYAFYRLWTAAEGVAPVPYTSRQRVAIALTATAGVAVAALAAFWFVPQQSGPVKAPDLAFTGWAQGVVFAWTIALFWLLARTVVVRRAHAGTRVWWIALAVASALLVDAKWSGLTDVAVVAGIALAARLRGMPADLVAASIAVAGGLVYTLSYVPYFTQGHGFIDMVAMQHDMYRYHATLVATHPWSSVWWQWPLLERPILYSYEDTRALAHAAGSAARTCCVAAIEALPNPFVWLAGLISVPLVLWWGVQERSRGYLLIGIAYLVQWLPWIASPRLTFEYHFFPNLALIVLANAVVLGRVWAWGRETNLAWPRYAVGAYAGVVVLGFAFFYPVLAGVHIPWNQWHARMWSDRWAS